MHRAILLGAFLLAASCSPQGRPPPEATASAETLELLPLGGEVWSFEVTLHGRLRGGARLAHCTLDVDRRAQEVAPAGSAFSVRLSLASGAHEVRARCRDVAGRTHESQPAHFTVKLSAAPTARPRALIERDELVLDGRDSTPNEGSRAPLTSYRWSQRGPGEKEARLLGEGERLVVPAPRAPGVYELALAVRDEAGEVDTGRLALTLASDGSARPLAGPTWLDTAIVYGVIPPLLGTPPLRAVTRSLDQLADLGVTVLWISPLYATTEDDFGYGVTDFFAVRKGFGDEHDLTELVREAHERELRVVLDLVVNHSSASHPYFEHAERLGERSRYFTYYQRDPDGGHAFYFDWEHLPNLRYDNPEVRALSLAFSRYWVERFDIDGYRADAAWGVQRRRPDFYPVWSRELRRVKPDLFLLAEAPARDPYYLRHGFDAAYDWTRELGQPAWGDVFSGEPGVAERLARAIEETRTASPRPERTLRFLNNNDTGARFVTRHGPALTRVATALLLTLPGIPCLYAFDELGYAFEPYQEMVPPQPEQPGFRAFHKALIALRKRTPALHGAGYRALVSDGELFVYLREGRRPEERAIVALNFGAEPAQRELQLPNGLATSPRLRDGLTGRSLPIRNGRLKLALTAYESLILLP